jgi:hypothetical protein
MGAWSTGAFGNDDAGDWVYELEGADDLGLCRDALEVAQSVPGYLDASDGAQAMAAAEVIAAAAGRRGADLPEEVEAWLDTVRPEPTPDDLELARLAVERVRGPRSELAELWADSPSKDEWAKLVDDLVTRLS